jgi:hypothetical protein
VSCAHFPVIFHTRGLPLVYRVYGLRVQRGLRRGYPRPHPDGRSSVRRARRLGAGLSEPTGAQLVLERVERINGLTDKRSQRRFQRAERRRVTLDTRRSLRMVKTPSPTRHPRGRRCFVVSPVHPPLWICFTITFGQRWSTNPHFALRRWNGARIPFRYLG